MLAKDVANLPDVVYSFDAQLFNLLEGLDREEPVATVQPTKGATWLPDVSFSHVGQSYRFNAWQVRPQNMHLCHGQLTAVLHSVVGPN